MVAASLGFGIVLVMPETMSVERRKLLRAYGADILLTPGSEAMGGAVRKAEAMAAEDDKYLLMQQFVNQANPEIHYQTTAPEIYDALEGKIHAFVAGVGTGGTISGVGKYLKEKSADIEVIAVEPVDSPVLSGGAAGPHTIQGIGAGFIPEVLDRSVVDRIITVSSTDAINCARLLGEKEGILGGISAGANVHVALELAKGEEYRGKTIVTVFCDTGERYLSTPLFA
jgi:cysteine synthase A